MSWHDEIKGTFDWDTKRRDELIRNAKAERELGEARRAAAKKALEGPVMRGIILFNDAVGAKGAATTREPKLDNDGAYARAGRSRRPKEGSG